MISKIPRVGLLINPVSGAGHGAKAGAEVAQVLYRLGARVVDYTGDTPAKSLSNIRKAVENNALDLLVVVGGDGTLNIGINGLVDTNIPLGLVAMGSGNDMAEAIGIPVCNLPASIDVLVSFLGRSGKSRRIDTVRVTRDDGSLVSYYGAVLSCGIDAEVNQVTNNMRFPRGRMRYVRAAISVIKNFEPYGFEITTTEGTRTLQGTLVSVASIGQFGGGMKIAPEALADDGFLDLVVADKASRITIAKIIPKVYSGAHVEHPAVNITRTRWVRIAPHPSGAMPPLAMADGEPMAQLPLTCTIFPSSLSVVVPVEEKIPHE